MIIRKLFANRLIFKFQDGGRSVHPLRAVVSTPFSTSVISLFQWTSVKRDNRRIITCFAVHFHEKKGRQLFPRENLLREVTGRNRKKPEVVSATSGCSKEALRLLFVLFLFFMKVDCKTGDNSWVANALSTCPGLRSLLQYRTCTTDTKPITHSGKGA